MDDAKRAGSITVTHISQMSDLDIINAECLACGWWSRVDTLAVLMAKGDLDFKTLREKLRCTRCGQKKVELQHSWGGGQPGYRMMHDNPEVS